MTRVCLSHSEGPFYTCRKAMENIQINVEREPSVFEYKNNWVVIQMERIVEDLGYKGSNDTFSDGFYIFNRVMEADKRGKVELPDPFSYLKQVRTEECPSCESGIKIMKQPMRTKLKCAFFCDWSKALLNLKLRTGKSIVERACETTEVMLKKMIPTPENIRGITDDIIYNAIQQLLVERYNLDPTNIVFKS